MFSELKKQSTSQSKESVQRKSGQASAQVLEDNRESNAIQRQPNRTGLPDNLKSGMESLSGKSLDHVKVHYNSSKPAAVQAHAYAQGSDIHLASGQEKHLPHELGHVVQQMEGRVKPTTSVGGMAVNDNPSLENEATEMGNRALKITLKDTFPCSTVNQSRNETKSSEQLQLKQIHEKVSITDLSLENTNHTFSVVDEVSKPDAQFYRGTEGYETTDNKSSALRNLAVRAGKTAKKVKEEVGKKDSKGISGYTRNTEDMNKSTVSTVDPFSHGHIQEYGSGGNYIVLIYQQSHGLDGYVNGIEEGTIDQLGNYASTFQQSMSRGKGNKQVRARMDNDEASGGNYPNLHDQNINQSLLRVAESDTAGKADAITKLAGEGARFKWVRSNIETINDSSEFYIGPTDFGHAYIKFSDLWCVWKEWFKGEYNISIEEQRAILLKKAKDHSKTAINRIIYK